MRRLGSVFRWAVALHSLPRYGTSLGIGILSTVSKCTVQCRIPRSTDSLQKIQNFVVRCHMESHGRQRAPHGNEEAIQSVFVSKRGAILPPADGTCTASPRPHSPSRPWLLPSIYQTCKVGLSSCVLLKQPFKQQMAYRLLARQSVCRIHRKSSSHEHHRSFPQLRRRR